MNHRRDIWAVVPVKRLRFSKRRLAPLLSRAERIALARAMLQDVLAALRQAARLAGVLVVTADDAVAAIARGADARVLTDEKNAGITPAVAAAARHLASAGVNTMLVIPADVPLITPQDIEAIVSTQRTLPGVTLVPAAYDGGTNALLCSPPDAVPFRFGEESFSSHQRAAQDLGIAPEVLRPARVGLDIDRPEDLIAFLSAPSPTRAYACLSEMGIPARVADRTRARSERSQRMLPSAAGISS